MHSWLDRVGYAYLASLSERKLCGHGSLRSVTSVSLFWHLCISYGLLPIAYGHSFFELVPAGSLKAELVATSPGTISALMPSHTCSMVHLCKDLFVYLD